MPAWMAWQTLLHCLVANDWSKRKNALVIGFVGFGHQRTVNIDLVLVDWKIIFLYGQIMDLTPVDIWALQER